MEKKQILNSNKLNFSLSNEEIVLKKLSDSQSSWQDKKMHSLLSKCLKMMRNRYNALLPHLNIKLYKAIKLHWAMSKIYKDEFKTLEIFNQTIHYKEKQGKRIENN